VTSPIALLVAMLQKHMATYLLLASLSTAGALALGSRISVAESFHSNAQQQAHYVPRILPKPTSKKPMIQTPTTANITRVSLPHMGPNYSPKNKYNKYNTPKGWQHRLGFGTAVGDRAAGVSRGVGQATTRRGRRDDLARGGGEAFLARRRPAQFGQGPTKSGNGLRAWRLARDEELKRRWLSRREADAPSWAKTLLEPQQEAQLAEACDSGDDVACETLSHEEEAKRAWLARVESDAPSWEAQQEAHLAEACDSGDDVACESLLREEEAKRAWLASLEANAPSWGPPKAGGGPGQVPPAVTREEEAKRRWLASVEGGAPSWGKTHLEPQQEAHLAEACDSGDDMACETLSREEEAKRAWLARVEADAPSWGPPRHR